MPQRVRLLAVVAVAALMLSIGTVMAQSSTSFNAANNSLPGVSAGGAYLQSSSFRLQTNLAGLTEMSMSSTSYELCTGFLCSAGDPFFRLRLPAIQKD